MPTNGIVIGIVTDLEDPQKLGRVRVKYPHLDDQESQWARLATPVAGPDRGVFFRPEVGDEVLVAFLQGDVRFPYIIGGLWSTVDKPPADDGKAKENNWRFIKSRSGHIIKLDDTQGAEKVEIVDKSGQNSVVIDTAQNTITISASGTIKVEAPTVTVEGSTVEVKGQTEVKVQAPTIEITAQGRMTIDGGQQLTIRGTMVNIN